ncbi:MAG: nucleotidyltransferase domain-containing protein [Candidatus Cloacimonetes bacterium]|nr:nucleotidyltransferase domain-containing protein [Candidatus Cloacimonadota bacterium]
MIDLTDNQKETVLAILDKHIPDKEVWLFGSRINGTAKKYSDLDLVIIGKKATERKVLYEVKEELSESDLPFRVDVLDYCRISESFKTVIKRNFEIFKPGSTGN